MNGWDALHHAISPSTRHYKDGKHNESVLNSCPIHNDKCHIGKESYLLEDEKLKQILEMIFYALVEHQGYALQENDIEFLTVYQHLYSKRIIDKYVNKKSVVDDRPF